MGPLHGRLLGMALFGGAAFTFVRCVGLIERYLCKSFLFLTMSSVEVLLLVVLPAMLAGLLAGGVMFRSALIRSPWFGIIAGMLVTTFAYLLLWVCMLLLSGFGHPSDSLGDLLSVALMGVLLFLLPAIPFGMAAGGIFYAVVRRAALRAPAI